MCVFGVDVCKGTLTAYETSDYYGFLYIPQLTLLALRVNLSLHYRLFPFPATCYSSHSQVTPLKALRETLCR